MEAKWCTFLIGLTRIQNSTIVDYIWSTTNFFFSLRSPYSRWLTFLMTSTGINQDKPLELIQKTYHLQTTNNNNHTEVSSHSRHSTVKVSNHQPSRKTSVHDVQEATREDLTKVKFGFHHLFPFLFDIWCRS